MSKKKRRRRVKNIYRKAHQREFHHSIANRQMLKRPSKVSLNKNYRKEVIPDDRRLHQPTRRLPFTVYGTESRIGLAAPNRYKNYLTQTKARLAFRNPRKVTVCKRRYARREALFATGRAGKGVRGPKYRKLNEYSDIKC